ncbi:hypothetical protein BDB01DRAFT_839144 [Pilobolus umbonatus]|nr:hypothetical protein BDB01DRAFT_839144 [Pilobolus umbonatus]
MDKLPLEIRGMIESQLPPSDLLQCARVCKSWYSLCIRALYRHIKLCNNHDLTVFHKTMLTNKELGKYVKSLDVSQIRRYRQKAAGYFRDLMYRCPYIEKITITPAYHWYRYILDKYLPEMKYLKSIECERDVCGKSYCLIDCYYRYRATISQITLTYMHNSHRLKNPTSILNYLREFPNLTNLSLCLVNDACNVPDMFDNLLDACPHLTTLSYDTTSPLQLTIDKHPDRRYESLTVLKVGAQELGPDDVAYIKKRLPYLEDLSLNSSDTIQRPFKLVEAFLSIIDTNHLYFSISNPDLDEYKDFVIYFMIRLFELDADFSHEYITTRNEQRLANEFRLEVKHHPVTGRKRIHIFLCPSLDGYRLRQLCLVDYGSQLTELKLLNHLVEQFITFDEINDLCPNLKSLAVSNNDFLSTSDYDKNNLRVNYRLTELTFIDCYISQPMFRLISFFYPNVRELFLDNCTIRFLYAVDNVYLIELPESGIETLRLRLSEDCRQRNIVIDNADQGNFSCRWCYQANSNKLYTDRNATFRFNRTEDRNHFLMRGENLKKVILVLEERLDEEIVDKKEWFSASSREFDKPVFLQRIVYFKFFCLHEWAYHIHPK